MTLRSSVPALKKSTPLVRGLTEKGVSLLGEIELAYSLCPLPIIAITGSNGKTTTTELTVKVLQGAGVRALACGNIGLSFSEAVLDLLYNSTADVHCGVVPVLAPSSTLSTLSRCAPETPGTASPAASSARSPLKVHDYDFFVVEISSFQLETTEKFHPNVAIWLNLSPNHLDRHPTMEAYRKAKLRIFKNQTEKDIAIIPKNFDRKSTSLIAPCLTFSAYETDADFSFEKNHLCYHGKPFLNLQETHLCGLHNVENLMAAFAVGVALDLDLNLMAEAVKTYTPPPHRCELVATHDGITWINDSKATTLEAMEKAIDSIKKTSPIILIAGGKNKGFSFAPIFPLVKKRVKKGILIGERSNLIMEEWPGMALEKASSMEEAVTLAAAAATSGDTILLSPGTSSYDMFKDYQERGERFKNLCQQELAKRV